MSSPDEIKEEIDATREELRQDVQALQSKVDPVENFDKGVARLQEFTATRPYAAGSAAFAAGWLAAWAVTRL